MKTMHAYTKCVGMGFLLHRDRVSLFEVEDIIELFINNNE